jgi:hypothetical protein
MSVPKISIKKVALGRVKCAVCGRFEQCDSDRQTLCIHCGSDLNAARGYVVNMVLHTEGRLERTLDAWEGALETASLKTQQRWAAFQEALEREPVRAQLAIAQARAGREDPLLSIVRLWLDYQDAGERYDFVRQWAQGLEEVLG